MIVAKIAIKVMRRIAVAASWTRRADATLLIQEALAFGRSAQTWHTIIATDFTLEFVIVG